MSITPLQTKRVRKYAVVRKVHKAGKNTHLDKFYYIYYHNISVYTFFIRTRQMTSASLFLFFC